MRPREDWAGVENEMLAPAAPTFGNLLRRFRLAAGLSQEALAERARVSSQGIGALERGDRRTPQRETVALLIEALALDAQERIAFEAAAARRDAPRLPGRDARTSDPWAGPSIESLPFAVTSFVGRDAEVLEIAQLARDCRLVTLTGPGGIGKTRTALEVGTALGAHSGGVRLVELAPIADASLLPGTIASALGLQPSPHRPALETLRSYLQREQTLLILDNCEHLVAEAAQLTQELLRTCPLLHVLATSREPLRAMGEHIYRLPALPAPLASDAAGLAAASAARFPAVTLFTERARAANHQFELTDETAPSVGEICARLDGMPLAIELAAARLSALSVESIAEKLRRRFALLAHGNRTAPARHQTMHATIEWSYDLLSPAERDLFERLAIFAGGWTLATATDACATDEASEQDVLEVLSSLVDKSLVVADVAGAPPRYRMLDSFRHFALERLGSRDDAREIAHRHARAMFAFAQLVDEEFDRMPGKQIVAIGRAELENVRAALEWSLELGNDVPLGQGLVQRMIGALELVAPVEAARWMTIAYERIDDRTPIDISARLDFWATAKTTKHGGYVEGAAAAIRSAERMNELGDLAGVARATFAAGQALYYAGEMERARSLLEDALSAARAVEASRLIGHCLLTLGRVHAALGNAPSAQAAFTRAQATYESCGSLAGVGHTLDTLAELAFREGDFATALRRVLAAIDLWHELDQVIESIFGLCNAAACLIELGRYAEALAYARKVLELEEQLDNPAIVAVALQHIATVAAVEPRAAAIGSPSDPKRCAALLLGYTDACYLRLQSVREHTERLGYERALHALSVDLPDHERLALMARGADFDEAKARALALAIDVVDPVA